MQLILLFGACLRGAQAFFGIGSCSEQPGCSSSFHLEPAKYQGPWYVIERDLALSLFGQNELCEASFIKMKDTSTMEETVAKNLLIFNPPVEPTELSVSELKTRVAFTNYDHFAVTTSCENYLGGVFHLRSASVLARSPELDDNYLDQALEFLSSSCSYNTNLLSKLWNWGCDFPEIGPPMETYCSEPSEFDDSVDPPARMEPARTSLDGSNVQISWSPPTLPEGTNLQGYKIKFRTSAGDFVELPDCLGCLSDTIKSMSCSLPLSSLWGEPMELKENDLVTFTTSALNEGGYSPFSAENSQGAKMPSHLPSQVENFKVITSRTFIKLLWDPPKNIGSSEIIGYKITSSCAETTTVDATRRSFFISGLQPLQTCSVEISAANQRGFGEVLKDTVEVCGPQEVNGVNLRVTETLLSDDLRSFTVRWSQACMSSSARYGVEFKDAGGNFFEHPDSARVCSGEEVQNSRTCKIDLVLEKALSNNFWMANSAVQVYISSPERSTLYSEEVPLSYAEHIPSAKIEFTSGTWDMMKFTCQSSVVATADSKYEILHKPGDKCYPPDSDSWWDDATVDGHGSSNGLFVSPAPFQQENPGHQYFGCRVTNAFGSGPIQDFINIIKIGSTAPSPAKRPQVVSVSPTSIDVEWEAPDSNGGYPINRQLIRSVRIESGCQEASSEASVSSSPYTYSGTFTPGQRYTVFVYQENTVRDCTYIHLYFTA